MLVGAKWRYQVTRPAYRFASGEEAIRQRDWKSVKWYASQLDSAGHSDHAHLLRAEMFYSRKDPDSALAECNQIKDEGLLRLRAASLSGKCLLDLGELKEAHRVFTFLVNEQPDNPDAHRGLASTSYDLGQMNRAVAHLEQVSLLDPGDARPHRLLGNIHRDTGNPEKAEVEYREALRIRTGLSNAALDEVRFELGEVLIRLSNYADTLTMLDEAKTVGAEPTMMALRIEALRGVGRRHEAAALADHALAEFPDGVFYRLRGQLYLEDGNAQAAVPLLEKAVQLYRKPYHAYFLLAQAYAGAGRMKDAERANARAEEIRRDLSQATELSQEAMSKPWDPKVRLKLAEVFDRLGDPDLASMWRKAAAACRDQRQ